MLRDLKYVSATEAVAHVQSHFHIHLSSIASVPQVLIKALRQLADAGEVKDLHFHHFHMEGLASFSEPEYAEAFFDQGFFVGPNVRANVNAGYADYIPTHLFESQAMYRGGAPSCDVALVRVSKLNLDDFVSLGISVDCSVAAIEVAKLKIAVVIWWLGIIR